jgi:hypothetical protein
VRERTSGAAVPATNTSGRPRRGREDRDLLLSGDDAREEEDLPGGEAPEEPVSPPLRYGEAREREALGGREPRLAAREVLRPHGGPTDGSQRPIRSISFAIPRSMASTR